MSLTTTDRPTAYERYQDAGVRLAQHVSNIDRIRKDPRIVAARTPSDERARDRMLAEALKEFRAAEDEFMSDVDRSLRRPVCVTEVLAEVEG